MPRGVGLAVIALLVPVAAVILAAPGPDQPVAVVGHTGVAEVGTSTTAATVRAAEPPTTHPVVVPATRPTTVVARPEARRVTIVNSGSESANTGGNTVVGPTDASVANGPATAVGNSSTVVVSRP